MHRGRYEKLSDDPHMTFVEVITSKIKNDQDDFYAQDWIRMTETLSKKENKDILAKFFKDQSWTAADMTTGYWYHNEVYGGEWYSPATEENLDTVKRSYPSAKPVEIKSNNGIMFCASDMSIGRFELVGECNGMSTGLAADRN